MKKITISMIILFVFGLFLRAQNTIIDQSNTRDGEAVEYCLQHKKQVELMQNPTYVQMLAQDLIIQFEENLENDTSTPKATVWYIPIVFHVLHDGGSENISDDQIIDAIEILNRDFKRENIDADNVHPDFQGMPADVDIEFRLATKAPNGSCFTGITRTQDALSNDGSDGGDQVDAIVDGNNVFQGQWPPNKYCNVYVCGDIGGAAGYTFTPSGWSGASMFYNGIFILDTYLGSIGTSGTSSSRTLTHEMGHWLNLSHVWGPNNNPGNSESCDDDDGVDDTPNEIGVTSCNLNESSCGPRANVENYMDYSYCSKMFTQGQVNRMRNALNSNTSGRNNLKTNTNLIATGADGNLYLCRADFEADRTSVCAGSVINFTDYSYNTASGWTWSFPGGSPTSSTSQNPSVTYNTPGIYEVILTATDGSTTDAEVKNSYIRVMPAASAMPFLEGFESYSTLNNINEWEIKNEEGNGFILATNTAYTGSNSVKLSNNNESIGTIDELISAPVDLSAVSSAVTLSFRYAYKRKNTNDNDWFRVYATDDCGQNWDLKKTLHGFQLSSQTQTSSFTPSSQSDWTTVHMTNIISQYWIDNFRYKFAFEAGGGNNIYIDDINIYNGAPSDEIVTSNLGLAEGSTVSGLGVYPNPTDGDLNIYFNLENDEDATIQIQDLTGKRVGQFSIKGKTGSNLTLVGTSNLSSGLYFLNVKVGHAQQTVQVVVK
jgi:PKD repeat protein